MTKNRHGFMNCFTFKPQPHHKKRGLFLFLVSFFVLSCVAFLHAGQASDYFSGTELKSWKVLNNFAEKMDVGQSQEGWLTIVPQKSRGWYQDQMGPMLYKVVKGDFMIETRVMTRSRYDQNESPKAHYNSAGLIVRDPASGYGRQNWFVVNVGRQDPHTGTEVKSTVNSQSKLELQPGSHNGQLRLARLGATVYALKKLDNEEEWTLIKKMSRSDLPHRVQVGLMCNGWDNGADLQASYDYAKYRLPKTEADLYRP